MDKSKWKYKKLGEVATFLNGYAFKPDNWSEHGLKIIRIQNLTDETALYNCYNGDIDPKYIVHKGDLLISWSATLGAFIWNNDDALLNQHIFKTIFDKSDIDKFYLRYCVISRLEEFSKKAHGITMRHITKKDFDNTIIPVPFIADQQRIVAELDCLNEMIALKQEQLKEFDKLAQSIFYDMFGDPITNEKGWDKVLMKQVIKVVGGYAFKSELFKDKGIPVLRIGNINTGEFRPINMVYWKEDDKLSRYAMYPGDLVVSLTGTVGKDDYGNVCILDNSYDKYYLNQRNAKLEILGNVEKLYLSRLLKIDEVKAKLTGTSRGVRQANISNRDIENLVIPLPPLALQQQFAEKIQVIEAQKELVKKSIAETQHLLDSRMDLYFD